MSLFEPRPRPSLEARVRKTLARLREERPDLSLEGEMRPLAADTLPKGPSLHLDDQSGIDVRPLTYDWSYLQDRARLRALDGDVVVASHAPPSGYESYCRDYLGLGSVTWLAPRETRHRTHLASHCWTDPAVRGELVRRILERSLTAVHPFMGTRAVWELAHLLGQHTHHPIPVVAPHPALTQWVNDKVEFARLVGRVYGDRWLPPTTSCSSLAALSHQVRLLAEHHRVIGVKLPDAAGGGGNIVLQAEEFRQSSLRAVRDRLRRRLDAIGWTGRRTLLVGAWESQVLSAPSAQLWIPPGPGDPIVDGVFEQAFEGTEKEFVGCRPSELPKSILDEIVDRSWLLGQLFQRLGYVGRCSFDLILVGERLDRSRLEFVECNGRWGGTSLPMTLVNRILPSRRRPRYLVRSLPLPSTRRVRFVALQELLDDLLFDRRTGRGRVVLFNPSSVAIRSQLGVIVFGQSAAEAQACVDGELSGRLRSLA